MVVPFEARQLSLRQSSSSLSSSPQITSLLFDPTSLSLALLHSDSSFSLYPSFSPFSLISLPSPQTFISAPTSSATFLPLQNPNRHLLFIVSSPSLGDAAVLLRFWILLNNRSFVKAQVSCNQRDLNFDKVKSGVVFNVNHGASVQLAASINVFTMYSVSNRKIWVFAVKMIGDEFDDNVNVKLMKTGVIDCSVPIFSITVSFGFLILGEYNGIRVFPLRPLVKGKFKKPSARLMNLADGNIQPINGGNVFNSNSNSSKKSRAERNAQLQLSYNENLDQKMDKHYDSAKLRSAKMTQDSREGGVCFVSFNGDNDNYNLTEVSPNPIKATSIEALSSNEFLIMDSVGGIHLLNLSNSVLESEVSYHMKQLSLNMKAQKMAVLPELSSRAQTFWISDGHYTVHTILLLDPDTSVSGGDRKDDDEKLTQISVTPVIFSSEKIQQIIPLAANAVLILGQGSLFAHAIS